MKEFPATFKRGDVVRSTDGRALGVVLFVEDMGEFKPGLVELHVDMPGQGVGIWNADTAVLSNDPASVEEARRLGLRGLS